MIRICRSCKHHVLLTGYDIGENWYEYRCRAHMKVETDYLSGHEHKTLGFCADQNKDGTCGKYDEGTDIDEES